MPNDTRSTRLDTGDHIYYHHANGDTYPGRVIRKCANWRRRSEPQRYRIRYNGLRGDVVANVLARSLTRQEDHA